MNRLKWYTGGNETFQGKVKGDRANWTGVKLQPNRDFLCQAAGADSQSCSNHPPCQIALPQNCSCFVSLLNVVSDKEPLPQAIDNVLGLPEVDLIQRRADFVLHVLRERETRNLMPEKNKRQIRLLWGSFRRIPQAVTKSGRSSPHLHKAADVGYVWRRVSHRFVFLHLEYIYMNFISVT